MNRIFLTGLVLVSSLGGIAQTKKSVVKPKTTSAGASSSALKLSADRGKAVYTMYCLACHQADGGGVPNLNPPLSKTQYVLGDKNRLIKIVLKGMDEKVEINGNFYSNPMPSHDFLKDQEIADVLTFVRNTFGNKADAITALQVKTARTAIKK